MHHSEFEGALKEILESDGNKMFPDLFEIKEAQKALSAIHRTTTKLGVHSPYKLKVYESKPRVYYPKIFLHGSGMGGQFDGEGVVLFWDDLSRVEKVARFWFCEHDWNENGSNHQRGYHRSICNKCKFDATIDSGD